MKIAGYQACLNSGSVINQDTEEGSILNWKSLHWSSTPDRVRKNRVYLEETGEGVLLQAEIAMELQPFTETMSFSEINPVEICLEAEADSAIVAYYYFKDWWTRPAFVRTFDEVPDETAILFFRKNQQYHFLLALPGKTFRAHFCGKNPETRTCGETAGETVNEFPAAASSSASASQAPLLRLILSADASGYTGLQETAMLAVTDSNPYHCMEKGMKYAAKLYGIPLREEREYPKLFQKIGWCSWDAFYKEVTEEKLAEKAAEIREKKIPFGWIIIDDGWQDYKNNRMISCGTDPAKFPDGLSGAVQKIREISGIHEIGVWHAFSGYWCGIDPDGPLAKEHPEWFISSHQGKLLPKPEENTAYDFYGSWYRELRKQGIHFVKVDSQSSTRQHYRTNTPIGSTSAALHAGLDRAVNDFLDGGLINCMGMAMEDVLQRPSSGVSRNSDDFFPLAEQSFKEHLLENVYNTIWHNIIYYGDWDMFWSSHTYAGKHALLRALSGGPVYVSDRTGKTNPEVLKPLCYEDGTILKAEKGAVPTVDCLLSDPEKSGYLKIQNVCGKAGYLAVYSYRSQDHEVPVKAADFSQLLERTAGIPEQKFAVYNVLEGAGFTCTAGSEWTCRLESEGYAFYQAVPIADGFAVFGRADKYLSSHAILERTDLMREGTSENMDFRTGNTHHCLLKLKESGPVRIYAEHMPETTVNGKMVPTVGEKLENFYRIELPVSPEPVEIRIAY